jgi:hypothetical protein
MTDYPLQASRRKRLTAGNVGSTGKGRSGLISTAIVLFLVAGAATCLIAPDQVDDALGRTVTVISDTKGGTDRIWTSVVTTLADEEGEEDQLARDTSDVPGMTTLMQGDRVTTLNVSRTLGTRGNDILEVAPTTTILVKEQTPESPATIIELLYGTLHVDAARRDAGETLSIETPYLVAIVKGTAFDVTTTEHGSAVAVTEGLVSVRSARSRAATDVAPGQTAIVSSVHGTLPTVIATPSGGALAAIKAATGGAISNANHHRR